MYAYLEGKLAELTPTYAVIDCAGVGYLLQISLSTYEKIQGQSNCKLHTYVNVREDEFSLYGFYSKIEKHTFELMITVSGIGPSTARTLLSTLPAEEFQSAILNGNVSLLKSVKGIGAKTAQRMVLELQDKMAKGADEFVSTMTNVNQNRDEAAAALVMLGFSKPMAEKALIKVTRNQGDTELSVEELIKLALKAL